jgi:hypothetical protein
MECPLCYDENATVRVKGCSHSFCYSCAKEWFTRNDVATCPMCRGPFKCKETKVWFEDKMNRDTLFEDGVNLILEAPKVYRWIQVELDGNLVLWGTRVDKMTKLKEFQLAYNAVGGPWCEWEDEEDFETFVLNDDVSDAIKDEKAWYPDDPTNRWVTRYPQII